MWINEKGGLNISIMAVAVGMYLSLKMTVPIFIGGMIKMYVSRRFTAPLKRTRPELFKKGSTELLEQEKERLHNPGILFASGLIAGEAIMGIGLAGMAVSGIYLGFIDQPSLLLGIGVFTICTVIMAMLSLKQTKNKDFGKIEEWAFEDNVQEAEMIEEKLSKTKKGK